MAMPQWYLSVDTVKEKMLNANKEINWVPDHIKDGRFGKWLENARDWAISRNRFWGTPLPVWESEDGEDHICIGSIEELKKFTGIEITDLHRETVDDMVIEHQGKKYKRIPEVFDCWFESGSMPYAQIHFPFENKEVFEKGFPAEFIAEGLDQTRGWFYTLTVLSAALYDKPAFKNVIVNGLVMAGDGKKMSKRLKNYTEPDVLMDEFGADALRLTFITSGLVRGEELKFTDEGVKDMVRRALLPWYNSFKFFQTYAKVDGFDATQNLKLDSENILDKWVLSKLQTLIKNVSFEMDHYRLYNVVPQLFNFIEDLTNWYIRLNRRRFWEGQDLTDDKCHAYSTLYVALKELSKIMAPFAPFLSEFIFRELRNDFKEEMPESVHLCDYPKYDESFIDSSLEDAVVRMQEIILLGRQKRNQVQVKVKTPLSTLTIIHKDQKLLNNIKPLEDYIKTELNVKSVTTSNEEDKYIKLYAKPNARVLGKKVGKRFKDFMAAITQLDSTQVESFEENGSIELLGEKLVEEDIFVFREAQKGSNALSNRWISIDLDTNLTPELVNEGLAREVVNRIQRSRKDLNFNVDDRIVIKVETTNQLQAVIEDFKDYIQSETLCNEIKFTNVDKGSSHYVAHDVEKNDIHFEINR
jgi:isoleucyl-tRNA synthetase